MNLLNAKFKHVKLLPALILCGFFVAQAAQGLTYDEIRSYQTGGRVLDASTDTTPPLITAVGTSGITSSSADVTWFTDELSNSQVEFGPDASYGYSTPVADASGTTSHGVAVTGLFSNTTYHFRVKSTDAFGNQAVSDDYTFTTSAPPAVVAPTINYFSANPPDIAMGGSADLFWSLSGSNASTTIDNGVGAVTGSSVGVSPQQTTTYTLTASNAAGSVSATTTVTVSATVSVSHDPLPAPYVPPTLKLVNDAGTYYLIQNGIKHGITNPGMLTSYGFSLSQAQPMSSDDRNLPLGSILTPGDGSLVKSPEDKTVYLISNQQRYAFTSADVFSNLGFSFSAVLLVTNPELQELPLATPISNSSMAHLPGMNISLSGTIYWVGYDGLRHAYPSSDVFNSWNVPNDFSRVVPGNSADSAMGIGGPVELRVTN